MYAEREYIVLYRTLVEQKYLLGNGENRLKQRDFEYLAEQIEGKSGIKLSLSTLKRLWKEDLTQVPHPATLDALVSILDFKNWQEFKQVHASQFSSTQNTATVQRSRKRWVLPLVAMSGLLVLTAAFFIIQGFQSGKLKIKVPKDVVFKADKTVAYGVPNTVQFTFDLKNVKADSFFIQQSWNDRDKFQIDPEKKFYSVIYYSPGFHWARIMADDEILRIEKVHIQTDGWLPIVKYDIRDNQNFYPDPSKIKQNGVMHITEEELQKQRLDLSKNFYLRYYNIRDFDSINSSNFEIETRLKCDSLRNIGCPEIELGLVMEEGMFWIPVTTKGCVGNLALSIGEVFKSGKDTDLSGLGADVYKWQILKVVNTNKSVIISLNNNAVQEMKYENDFGRIKGMLLTFTGTGSVDYFRIGPPDSDPVYTEDFN